jgi:hypothetical protein
MSDNRNLQKLVQKIINAMPDEISDEELVCIILNLVMLYSRHENWPKIQSDVGINIVMEVMGKKNDVRRAVQDADDFLGRIVNDAG